MNDQHLLHLMFRPTSETHCPACLENWYALGIDDPCPHDRRDDGGTEHEVEAPEYISRGSAPMGGRLC